MKNLFYIRNTKTDQNYDTMDEKFYDSSWTPVGEQDKNWLQDLIELSPEKFKNCIVEML